MLYQSPAYWESFLASSSRNYTDNYRMLPYPHNLLDQSFGDKMHRFKANLNNKANWQQIHEI
jgi:hypothetical protein